MIMAFRCADGAMMFLKHCLYGTTQQAQAFFKGAKKGRDGEYEMVVLAVRDHAQWLPNGVS